MATVGRKRVHPDHVMTASERVARSRAKRRAERELAVNWDAVLVHIKRGTAPVSVFEAWKTQLSFVNAFVVKEAKPAAPRRKVKVMLTD